MENEHTLFIDYPTKDKTNNIITKSVVLNTSTFKSDKSFVIPKSPRFE